MTSLGDDPTAAPHPSGAAIGRHAAALGSRLDIYLDAVAWELQARGVVTGSPQRTDPSQRLIGSIVVDCTAVREAARADHQPVDDQRPPHVHALGGAVHPERSAPVIVTWDEVTGWCAGLHHDSIRSSRRYLHPDVLPPAVAVAEFVVGLALGRPVGAAHPLRAPGNGRRSSRLAR